MIRIVWQIDAGDITLSLLENGTLLVEGADLRQTVSAKDMHEMLEEYASLDLNDPG